MWKNTAHCSAGHRDWSNKQRRRMSSRVIREKAAKITTLSTAESMMTEKSNMQTKVQKLNGTVDESVINVSLIGKIASQERSATSKQAAHFWKETLKTVTSHHQQV